MKLQFEPRLTLGNVIAVGGFLVAAGSWYALNGAALKQIRLDQERADTEIRAINARLFYIEKRNAVYEEQANWIIRSLERLQSDRGIHHPPAPIIE